MKRKLLPVLLLIVLCAGLLPASAGAFSGYWGYLSPGGKNSALRDIAYGNGVWVAVGNQGAVVTSADGTAWMPRTSGVETELVSVAYGNGRFVAVGKQPVVSQNGTAWQKSTYSGTGTMVSVIFAAGKFTAATDKSTVYDSVDGLTWTLAKSFAGPYDPAIRFQSITYANGVYDLIDSNFRQWEYGARQWQTTQGWNSTCSRILYLGGQYLGLCSENLIVTGTADGRNWARRNSQSWEPLRDAVHDGRRYVAVGDRGTIVTSPDGITWTEQAKPKQIPWPNYYTIEYANGLYAVSGDNGRIWTSTDAASWTLRYSTVGSDLAAIAGTAATWVAVGNDGTVMSTANKEYMDYFIRRESGTQQPLRGVAAGADTFVAVGAKGTVITSADGKAWQSQTSGTDADLQTVIFANGQFLAAGPNAAGKTAVITSADGLTWKSTEADLPGLRALAYGQGQYVAVGAAGFIATSPDGAVWTRQTSPVQADLYGVAFGGGRFMAVGGAAGSGAAITSTDGVTWSQMSGAGVWPLYGVAYGPDRFIVTGGNGVVPEAGYSADGLTVHLTTGQMGDTRFVAVQGNRVMAVGRWGAISYWSLLNSSKSSVKLSADTVKLGAEVSVTAVLINDEGRTQSGMRVNLVQEPALLDTSFSRQMTDTKGEAKFTIKGMKNGTVTLTVIADDGTVLGQPVTLTVGPECGQRFADVPAQHPNCQAIELLAEQQVIKGFPDGFHPDQGLTRAELATLLVRGLKLEALPNVQLPFSDAQGHWAEKAGYLQAAWWAGAFGGMPDGTFQPDAPVTRAQLVKVVTAVTGLKPEGTPTYSDVPSTAWYAGWVNQAGRGLLIGPKALYPVFTGTTFGADQPATRAEAAAILANLLH